MSAATFASPWNFALPQRIIERYCGTLIYFHVISVTHAAILFSAMRTIVLRYALIGYATLFLCPSVRMFGIVGQLGLTLLLKYCL